jgi:hypothetical protein
MRRPALLLLLAAITACGDAQTASQSGYEPAHLDAVAGREVKLVTFTAEGARRTGVETAAVRRRGAHLVVPYAALVYDGQGESFVYTSPRPLRYLRAPVTVDRVAGDAVLLSSGPKPGTAVVTIGATEVYGTELEIAGGH